MFNNNDNIVFYTISFTLLCIAFYLLLNKLKNIRKRNKKSDNKKIYKRLSIGFYLGVENVIIMLLMLAYNKFIL